MKDVEMTMYGPKYCLESLPVAGGMRSMPSPTIKLETCVARVISIQLYTEAIGRCGDDGILSDIHNRRDVRVYGLREGRKTRKTSVRWCKPNMKETENACCRCCLVCRYGLKRSL